MERANPRVVRASQFCLGALVAIPACLASDPAASPIPDVGAAAVVGTALGGGLVPALFRSAEPYTIGDRAQYSATVTAGALMTYAIVRLVRQYL